MFHVIEGFFFGIMSHDTVWVSSNAMKGRAVSFLSNGAVGSSQHCYLSTRLQSVIAITHQSER